MYILMALGFFILLFVAYRYYRTHSLRWVLMIFGVLLIAVDWYGIKQAQVHHFGMVKQEINKSVAIQPKATVSNFNFITISEAKNGSAQYHTQWNNVVWIEYNVVNIYFQSYEQSKMCNKNSYKLQEKCQV